MLTRLILAVIVGIVTFIVLYVVGALLATVDVTWVSTLGSLLKQFSSLLGLIAGVWYYFTGQTPHV